MIFEALKNIMKKILLGFLFLFIAVPLFAFDIPSLDSRVNDKAGVLSSVTKNKLEKLLEDYENKTTNQFFVLTVDSIQNAGTIEQYGIAVADKWKPGNKKEDNGLILIVSVKERKVRFEVGYGLEGKFPDVVAFRIIKEQILPYFRTGDYDSGVSAGVVYAIDKIGGYDLNNTVAAGSSLGNKKKNKGTEFYKVIVLLVFLSMSFIFRLIFSFGSRSHSSQDNRAQRNTGFWGGGFGSGGGGFGSGGFGGGGGGGFGGGGSSGGW